MAGRACEVDGLTAMHGTKASGFTFVDHPTVWNFMDLTGQRYGRLVVEGYVGKAGKHIKWGCLCDCGSRVVVFATNMRKGNTTSCGCAHSEKCIQLRQTHGMTHTPEYWTHQTMIQRCAKPQKNNKHHERGIRVCERWLIGENGLTGFECFLSDMGLRPSDRHSIERTDNDGNYEPMNCIWATKDVQANNTTRNVIVEHNGERLTATQIARRFGINPRMFAERIRKGWSIDRAILPPSVISQ